MAVRGRSWSVGSSSLRMGLESSECEGELAQRLLMVSGEADRDAVDARPNGTSNSESGRLSVVEFCSNQRWIWIRAFRGSWGGGDNLGGHFCGHRSRQGARKR